MYMKAREGRDDVKKEKIDKYQELEKRMLATKGQREKLRAKRTKERKEEQKRKQNL